jgi:hypothetical protein
MGHAKIISLWRGGSKVLNNKHESKNKRIDDIMIFKSNFTFADSYMQSLRIHNIVGIFSINKETLL